jgi:hypothetical protein
MKLLPEVPTDEMMQAGCGITCKEPCYADCKNNGKLRDQYKAMYVAASNVECEPVAWTNAYQLDYLKAHGTLTAHNSNSGASIPLYTIPQDQSKRIAELENRLADFTAMDEIIEESQEYKFTRLKFFRDISFLERVKFLKVFGMLPQDYDEHIKESILGQLFDKLFKQIDTQAKIAELEAKNTELKRVLNDERNSANELTKSLVEKVKRNKELEAKNAKLIEALEYALSECKMLGKDIRNLGMDYFYDEVFEDELKLLAEMKKVG